MAEEKKKTSEQDDAARARPKNDDDSSDDSSVSSEEDDDLGLEGVLIRNPDASSSSEDESEEEVEMKPPAKSAKKDADQTAGSSNNKKNPKQDRKNKKKSKKKKQTGPEIINVEFTFHDFDEKYFHGVKALLHGCSTVYQPHSSALTDLMIDNISVGTVCSTEGDVDGNVFGFGSVLNLTTYGDKPCIQYLKKLCLDHCPKDRTKELETVLSGKTARPAGFFFHGRMVNMPLEIVEVLQQQLVADMDWAVTSAEGGEAERKSLDFGAFVRLAPATADGNRGLFYKFFDDEIFASHAEFSYTMDAPPSYGSEEKLLVNVIVMTKTGYRAAMQELKQFVGNT